MNTRKFLYQLSTLTVLIGMAFNLIGCMGVLPRTTDQQADEPVEQYGNGYRYEKKTAGYTYTSRASLTTGGINTGTWLPQSCQKSFEALNTSLFKIPVWSESSSLEKPKNSSHKP